MRQVSRRWPAKREWSSSLCCNGHNLWHNASGYAKNTQRQRKSVMAKETFCFEQLKKSLNIFTGQSQASNVNNEIGALIGRVKNIVGNNLGIIRNELKLTEGKGSSLTCGLEIKGLDERNKDVFELQQMARLANVIEAAFQRTESRGVPFRSD